MPEMDGFEATRVLRAKGIPIPILSFTASASVEDKERCMEAGMNGFVSKPIVLEELQDELSRVLTRDDV